MNGFARPAHKHYLLYLPPFACSTAVDPSANSYTAPGQPCCPLRVVASRILRSFEFDGQELFGSVSNPIPSSLRRQNLS